MGSNAQTPIIDTIYNCAFSSSYLLLSKIGGEMNILSVEILFFGKSAVSGHLCFTGLSSFFWELNAFTQAAHLYVEILEPV
jgi:hypothetical protein